MAGPTDGVYAESRADGDLGLVLGALRWNWGEAYEIGVHAGLWYANRLDGIGKIEVATVDELRDAILKDYTAKPVPRDPPAPPVGDSI